MRYVYGLFLIATAVAAVLNFRLRCESFGCMGLGVAWFAWSGLYLLTLLVGLFAWLKTSDPTGKQRVQWALWGQLAGGLALTGYWLLGTATAS